MWSVEGGDNKVIWVSVEMRLGFSFVKLKASRFSPFQTDLLGKSQRKVKLKPSECVSDER